MRQSSAMAHPRARAGGIGLAVGLTVLVMLGAGALGYVGYVLWPQWPKVASASDAPSLPISVDGVVFNVPPLAIRSPLQRSAGAQPRLDLMFQWPDLAPPAAGATPTLSDELKPNHLFVTITGPQGTLPLMERMRTIYPRYVEGTAFTGPAGLTGVPFRNDTPYRGEDLLFDVDHPQSFSVRCTRPAGPAAGMCLLERRVGTAEVTVRFPRDWLSDWRTLSAETDKLLARLHAASPG